MRHLIALVLALAAVGADAAAPKSEAPPLFVTIPAVSENAWLTMDCAGTGSLQTIRCRFTQIRIHRKSDAEVAATVADVRAKLQAKPDSIRKMASEICPDWEIIGSGNLVGTEEWTPDRVRARVATGERMTKLCACSDDACRIESYLADVESGAKECRIISTNFDATLKRVGKTKWMNEPTPTGACNAVTAMVIERASENEWTFTQTRLAVDVEIPACAGLAQSVNRPYIFASDPSRDIMLECSTIRADIL